MSIVYHSMLRFWDLSALLLGSEKKIPKLFLYLVLERHFLLLELLILNKLAFYRVGKLPFENMRQIENSKHVNFIDFSRLP